MPAAKRALVTGFALGCLAAAAACASILGIPDRSLEWCLQPGNAHPFCEDFDHQNPTEQWSTAPPPVSGASRTFVPSSFDPPNAFAMDTTVGPLMAGVPLFSGLQQSFVDQVFGRVVVGLDVRIVTAGFMADPDDPTVQTGAGFLLLSDVVTAAGQSECIGLALSPAGADQVTIDVELVPNSNDCLTLNPLMGDSGVMAMSDADAPMAAPTPVPSPLANVFLNQWFRLTLDVTRQPDGSGTIDFRVPSVSSMAPPMIPAGSLSEGVPSLGIGTDVIGPSGTFEIQFDNVTVDFPAAN